MSKLSSLQVSTILAGFVRYRVIIVALIMLGLFGFTLIKATAISNPQIDPDYQRSAREDIETATLTIDPELEARIQSLQETPVDESPSGLGTRDPFNP